MNIQQAINALKPLLEEYRTSKEKGHRIVGHLAITQFEALEILMDEVMETLPEKGRINKGIAEREGWKYVDNFSMWANPQGQPGFVTHPDYFEGGTTLAIAEERLRKRSPGGFTIYNQIATSFGIQPPPIDTKVRALYAAWLHVIGHKQPS